jgi:hypothetical protein
LLNLCTIPSKSTPSCISTKSLVSSPPNFKQKNKKQQKARNPEDQKENTAKKKKKRTRKGTPSEKTENMCDEYAKPSLIIDMHNAPTMYCIPTHPRSACIAGDAAVTDARLSAHIAYMHLNLHTRC